jgi:hypothetical protein
MSVRRFCAVLFSCACLGAAIASLPLAVWLGGLH